jgi:hypothetical protein
MRRRDVLRSNFLSGWVNVKKKLAIVCGVLFLAAFFCSAAYMFSHRPHRYIGRGCDTCCKIENILGMLNRENAGPEPDAPVLAALSFLLAFLAPLSAGFSYLTPIALKVKMSC